MDKTCRVTWGTVGDLDRSVAPGSIASSANPQGIILVYDITDEKSFENIQNWMKSIKEVSGEPRAGRGGGAGAARPDASAVFARRMPLPGWSACCWGTSATWRPRGRCSGSRRTRSGSAGRGSAGAVLSTRSGHPPFFQLPSCPPDSWLGSTESDFSRRAPNPA